MDKNVTGARIYDIDSLPPSALLTFKRLRVAGTVRFGNFHPRLEYVCGNGVQLI